VKTAFLQMMVVLGCVGLVANSEAQTQSEAVAPEVIPPGSAVTSNGNAVPPATGKPVAHQPNGNSATAATVGADSVVDDSLLIDNGLWEGADVGPGCPKCGGCMTPADWYTMQGARVLSRSSLRNQPLIYQTLPQGNFTAVAVDAAGDFQVRNLPGTTLATRVALNTKQFGLGVSPAYDATIGHYFMRDRNNNDYFVELSFWGLTSWATSKTVDGYLVSIYDPNVNPPYSQEEATLINQGLLTPVTTGESVGSLRTPYPTPLELPAATEAQKTLALAFDYGTLQSISYRSSINNVELNGRITPRGQPDRLVLHPDGRWQRECQEGRYISYLYGLRFMEIDESFSFYSRSHGFRDPNPSTVPPIYDATGTYDINTHNSLLGLQIGTEMLFRKCKWSWGLAAKMGPYLNFASQQSDITATVDGQPQFNVDEVLRGSHCSAALMGELAFEATYKFRPNLVGRATWDFMWITNLALAPEQVQFVAEPTSRVNTNGSIFSQGPSLGLEWMW
jgi:hypothetical protein